MSRRKRTTQRQNVSSEVLDEARKLIEKGQSKRSVAEHFGMAESTLRKRLKYSDPPTKLGRYETTFSCEVEKEFKKHLNILDNMYFGLTAKGLRGLAFEYAKVYNIPNRFNAESKLAGKEWLRCFLKRHPDISLRQPTATSVARAMGFNQAQVDRFYVNLTALKDQYNFPPHRIFNMDETGITTVPNKPPKVLSTKGKRSVNKISSAERGVNMTTVNAMSPTGIFVPPAFIFGRKRMKAELLDGAPMGSVGMVSDSSFINTDLFLDWLTHFKDHTKPSKEDPVLLILDNHVSHCTISAINYYRENHIIALTLPPHASHKLQPLDCGFHTILKKYYANECEKWLRNHPGRAITVFQMVGIFTPAYLKAATLSCAAQSFKVTGIEPYDPDVFTEADFLASSVTDKELPTTAAVISEPKPQPSTSHLVEVNRPIDTTEKSSILKAVENISPIPKASDRQTTINRKRKKSEIISSSPYKLEIEKQMALQTKPKLKLDTKNTRSKEFNIPKTTPKKKIWRCGGCQEIYKEPITEDWIGCSVCQQWWHENCTSYLGKGLYICDECTKK
ncbi:uncharacterized protein [Epargyreus clarus]|uniref:uncharacterized protein n=1 Tax=Epargyreus clarus TaxID=520877 RepID=UPI003C2F01B9